MPRLLQIDSCLGVLSTGKITEGIARVASDAGWECFIAHGSRYVGKSNMKSFQVSTKIGEYLHYAYSVLSDGHGLGSTLVTKRLIKRIEEEIKPDIIHLHCIHGYYLNYKILFEYLNKANIPVVWTFHDCWAFTGHCAHFVTKKCHKWSENGCSDCPLLNAYPKSVVDFSSRNFALKKSLFLANRNMHIVAVSDWMGNQIKKSFFRDFQLQVIRNGINLSVFSPCGARKPKFTIIGVASSWNEDKGLYDFYKLRTILPENRFDVLLVGLTQSQIDQLPVGISGYVRTDTVQDLALLYSSASVLVNPTYADTFPTVNLEALACGTPVITYDTGGSPEAIDEHTGVVVSQGDVEALAEAVIKLCAEPLSSQDCRQRAVELYDQNRCYMQYVNLYDSLMNR